MKTKSFYKAFILILMIIFIVFIITVSVYGLKIYFADNKSSRIAFEETGSFLIFVGGAVEDERFYEVRYSTTYGELFNEVGVLNEGSLSRFNYNEAVNFHEEFIICNYENFLNKNINYAAVEDLIACGIPEDKAHNIRAYIDDYGKIKDKNILTLEGLLTEEEFDAVKYKIYAYVI